jgi:hypothetical protein
MPLPQKQPGDLIQSADWNAVVTEVEKKVDGMAAGPIQFAGTTRTFLRFLSPETGPSPSDGFRIRYDSTFFGGTLDGLIIEKTDGNEATPDGGIAFVNTGNTGNSQVAFVIRGDGKIGVGTEHPQHPIHVFTPGGAQAHLSAAGQWVNASSRQHKEAIVPLPLTAAMEALKQLEPVTFRSKNDGSETHVGFIAEDVPDLVATPDRKGLCPMDIIAVLTKVVQHQEQEITRLKAALDVD